MERSRVRPVLQGMVAVRQHERRPVPGVGHVGVARFGRPARPRARRGKLARERQRAAVGQDERLLRRHARLAGVDALEGGCIRDDGPGAPRHIADPSRARERGNLHVARTRQHGVRIELHARRERQAVLEPDGTAPDLQPAVELRARAHAPRRRPLNRHLGGRGDAARESKVVRQGALDDLHGRTLLWIEQRPRAIGEEDVGGGLPTEVEGRVRIQHGPPGKRRRIRPSPPERAALDHNRRQPRERVQCGRPGECQRPRAALD